MLSWSAKRKFVYISWTVFIIVFLLGILLVFNLYTPATCFDGKQNQDELGIDCGGACSLLCEKPSQPITMHFSRVFEIKEGVFSVFAYIENPNRDVSASEVPYDFKLYDSKNILVYSGSGKFNLPAGRAIGIFESGLRLGDRNPIRADFNIYSDQAVWKKSEPQILAIYPRDTKISQDQSGSKVNAEFVNRGETNITDLNVVAILYDNLNNAIGVSKTIVTDFSSGSVRTLIFTWPQNFITTPSRTDYLYWVDSGSF